jgi:flagellar hook-associated protein 1 FlgK
MPGLFTALATSANVLTVYEKVFETIGNNINNANTPGYAKQTMSPLPLPFDPAEGLAGGIMPGQLESSRSEYAEQAVWSSNSSWGDSDQLSTELSNIQPLFDVTGDTGLPNALNQFFQSFSALSLSPNDTVARSTVLDRVGQLAQQFNGMATGLNDAVTTVNNDLQNATGTINGLAGQIASINGQIQEDAGNRDNAATDTALHNALENLAEYTNYTALEQPDGTVMVLIGGQTPLVIGNQSYAIGSDTGGGAEVLRDSNGGDITSQIGAGRLSALIDMRNSKLPQYLDQLNQLAAGLADSVNGVLGSGVDANGDPGAPLFTYDSQTDAAFTLQAADLTPDQLAAAHAGAPGGNGNALDLNALGSTPQINGLTFTQFYGQLAGQVGSDLQGASADAQTRQDLLTQARSMRSDISSVSLDEEAARLIEYQKAYEATAKAVTTLNELTQTTIDMFR